MVMVYIDGGAEMVVDLVEYRGAIDYVDRYDINSQAYRWEDYVDRYEDY